MKSNEMYCVKCKKAVVVPLKDRRIDEDRGGRRRFVGECPKCGTTMYRYMSQNEHEELMKEWIRKAGTRVRRLPL